MANRGGPWTREEDILALSIFVKRGMTDDKDSAVIELSQMIGRSVGSVVRKLANFLAVETNRRHGLKHFAAMDQTVYQEFRSRAAELEMEAERLRATYRVNPEPSGATAIHRRLRPIWVFQAREYEGGHKSYALYEELPKVLERDSPKRVVHWGSAEHKYTPVRMGVGDEVLLFQGATKEHSARGFYGHAVISNLNGRCAAPAGETGSHSETNRHNRAVGVDLRYLGFFGNPILPSVRLGSPLANKNLQKLIAEGREGSAQETVFAISDEDWGKLSLAFEGVLNRGRRNVGRRAGTKVGGGWKRIDPERKAKIEASAVRLARTHFEDLAYDVSSVEKDNLGWDLEATKDGIILHLEVKGLSGDAISVELTPNEYKHIRSKAADYRICVVTQALEDPLLSVFLYTERSKAWENEDGEILKVHEITGARMFRP